MREKLLNDLRDQHGPFDVIGDVHGCRSELETLLDRLGYALVRDGQGRPVDATHPEGRRPVFVGDLVDRGPDSPGVLRLVMGMVGNGHALCVPGNHENKLVRALGGRQVQVTHGLEETLAQLARETPEFRSEVAEFCYGLVSHLVLDDGRLVVAHAGLKEAYHGRASGRVRSFALYGDSTGETDEFGLPVRYPWADDYRGRAMVLYGHTPTPELEWVNNTLCLDTGCVFGGRLSALRYPEKETVSVPAEQVWYEPVKPFPTADQQAAPTDQRDRDQLDIGDVLGKRVVETAHHGHVTVREENAAGALEVMSRFALHPRWLPYLPPTMAPPATSKRDDLLEHPDEAFAAYSSVGVHQLVCEEKHMGSRAVVLVCRDDDVAASRFGATDGETGAAYTRTGRSFFDRRTTEAFLERVRTAADGAGLWEELDTDWLLLDSEILPWSAKAGDLLRDQYAAVGAAARAALPARGRRPRGCARARHRRRRPAGAHPGARRQRGGLHRGLPALLLAHRRARRGQPSRRSSSSRRTAGRITSRTTCGTSTWQTGSSPRRRTWCGRPAACWSTPRTPSRCPPLSSGGSRLTAAGGEGMVVKPLANLTRTRRGLVQPGIKVRGREYLRIIYGPDYTEPQNLARLRDRNLGHKRSLALREYALGLEALERLARGEPLWRVHEAVFAVLALESEPVDPRL